MEWFEVSKVLDRSKYTVMRVSTFSMWFVMESTTFNADSSVEIFFYGIHTDTYNTNY